MLCILNCLILYLNHFKNSSSFQSHLVELFLSNSSKLEANEFLSQAFMSWLITLIFHVLVKFVSLNESLCNGLDYRNTVDQERPLTFHVSLFIISLLPANWAAEFHSSVLCMSFKTLQASFVEYVRARKNGLLCEMQVIIADGARLFMFLPLQIPFFNLAPLFSGQGKRRFLRKSKPLRKRKLIDILHPFFFYFLHLKVAQ